MGARRCRHRLGTQNNVSSEFFAELPFKQRINLLIAS